MNWYIANMKMKILAIIPARGGSKGIPRKNIKHLAGKPLIAWTIQAALDSQVFDRIIVSTEDEEISRISQEYGAEVPFLRPIELASDHAKSIDLVLNLLKMLAEKEQYFPDAIMLLQPTSPFREVSDILEVTRLFQTHTSADALVSVCAVDHPISWLKEMTPEGKLISLLENTPFTFRRQDSQQVFELNGSIYLLKTKILQQEQTFLPKNTFGYVMSNENSIDIDTPWDFHLADLIMRDKHVDK